MLHPLQNSNNDVLDDREAVARRVCDERGDSFVRSRSEIRLITSTIRNRRLDCRWSNLTGEMIRTSP